MQRRTDRENTLRVLTESETLTVSGGKVFPFGTGAGGGGAKGTGLGIGPGDGLGFLRRAWEGSIWGDALHQS
jgi:hypothetical protein